VSLGGKNIAYFHARSVVFGDFEQTERNCRLGHSYAVSFNASKWINGTECRYFRKSAAPLHGNINGDHIHRPYPICTETATVKLWFESML